MAYADIEARIQSRIAAQAQAREAELEEATIQAKLVAGGVAAAADQDAKLHSAQLMTHDYVLGLAEDAAKYIVSKGAQPNVPVDRIGGFHGSQEFANWCWLLGIAELSIKGHYQTHHSGGGPDGGGFPGGGIQNYTLRSFNAIGLQASGQLIHVRDLFGVGVGRTEHVRIEGCFDEVKTIDGGRVNLDTIVPLEHVDPSIESPALQPISVRFEEQLEILGAHAIAKTMDEYNPFMARLTVDIGSKKPEDVLMPQIPIF